MSNHPIKQRFTKHITVAASVLALLIPATIVAQEVTTADTLERRVGDEILQEAVDLEVNSSTACILKEAGDVFCWKNDFIGQINISTPPNQAGYETTNIALDNDISEITLGIDTLCAIGQSSGVACTYFGSARFDVNPGLDNPPEPDASYLSISSISVDQRTICGIQTDNRVVCWGESAAITNVPAEAAYLKQVSVQLGRACGIDLNDNLVCWGDTAADPQFKYLFGTVDPSTIDNVKEIALSPYGACVINANDELDCFHEMSDYADVYAGQTFKNIDIDSSFGPKICYDAADATRQCERVFFYTHETSIESQIPEDAQARLISSPGRVCYIEADNSEMNCLKSTTAIQNQFPSAPENLTVEVYSDNAAELFWTRPLNNSTTDEYTTGYEVYRDGNFIQRLRISSSFFDSNSNPGASYELRPTRGAIAGTSSFVSVDGIIPAPVIPTSPPPPVEPELSNAIRLTGLVYSSSAIELFWNQNADENIRFNIFRNGELIREGSPALSQFDAGLEPNTAYTYGVAAVVDGNTRAAAAITLTTLNAFGEPPAPVEPVRPPTTVPAPALTGEVYSSTSIELFWNRAANPNVRYNIFRDGELIRENSPAISQFDAGLTPGTTYTYGVAAILDGNTVASSAIELTTPSDGTEPVIGLIAPPVLTGEVYSSTAVELFWNRSELPGVTYSIFRDGELIREDSPAASQFDSGLAPGTTYVYFVVPFINGEPQTPAFTELTTRTL